MSDYIADMPRLELDDVNLTRSPADNIDWSQFYDMFMNIEQRLPSFDHMLMAMNDYAFQRTSRQRQTNDLIEFSGVIKKGLIDWYTSSINNKINRVPDFIDLTNKVFGDDTLMKVDKKLVSSTSPKTNANESTNTSGNTDANECTNISGNTDANESTNISGNTDANESTDMGATADVIKSTALYNPDIDTNTSGNADANESTNISYRELASSSVLGNASQSTETNVDTVKRFKIIMPHMTENNAKLRKMLDIDYNTHLGNEYERFWWRQTNDIIVLNVDLSDLIVEVKPKIKVELTRIGFRVRVRRSNKWIVILSNKFEKPIKKIKWEVNKYKHVKLTITKNAREFWSKCLVTETREIDLSNFENHLCSDGCNTPQLHREYYAERAKKRFQKFIREEYDYGDIDAFMEQLNATNKNGQP